jgi:uncharacterized damage-inducible protein DinB
MTADEVRARIRSTRKELVDLIATIDEAALSAPGPDGGWAIKDHLVHIGAWEHWLLALFERRDRLAAMGAAGAGKTVDEVNAAVYEKHRGDTLEQARAYFDDAHDQLMVVLDTQSTEDFERPYNVFFTPAEGESSTQPVLVAVAANTYEHYDEHIGWIKEMRAKPQQR